MKYADGKIVKENILEESKKIEAKLLFASIRQGGFKLSCAFAVEDGLFDFGSFKHSIETQFAHEGIKFNGEFRIPRSEEEIGKIELLGSVDKEWMNGNIMRFA